MSRAGFTQKHGEQMVALLFSAPKHCRLMPQFRPRSPGNSLKELFAMDGWFPGVYPV
jgi:hypothetical protein